jgi:pimeloyl-ACP methyl ester carboxylesterase
MRFPFTVTQRNLLGPLVVVAGLVVAAVVASYFWWPTTLIDGAMQWRRRSAGLERRYAWAPQGKVPYLIGGPDSTRAIVLLHGFGQDKDAWIDVARELRADQRVVIPDLFGFGENLARVLTDYRPITQARRLHGLLGTLGLKQVDLVGWSMGGEIAAAFAYLYPGQVRTLALIGASGVRSDTLTPLDRRLLDGENVFRVTDLSSLNRMLALLNDSGVVMPDLLKRAIVVKSRRRAAQWDTVFTQFVTEPALYQLDSIAPMITTRTLVLWGARDPLYHVSAARRLAERLPNAELEILPDCGQVCPASRPREVVARYRAFLRQHAAALALR